MARAQPGSGWTEPTEWPLVASVWSAPGPGPRPCELSVSEVGPSGGSACVPVWGARTRAGGLGGLGCGAGDGSHGVCPAPRTTPEEVAPSKHLGFGGGTRRGAPWDGPSSSRPPSGELERHVGTKARGSPGSRSASPQHVVGGRVRQAPRVPVLPDGLAHAWVHFRRRHPRRPASWQLLQPSPKNVPGELSRLQAPPILVTRTRLPPRPAGVGRPCLWTFPRPELVDSCSCWFQANGGEPRGPRARVPARPLFQRERVPPLARQTAGRGSSVGAS